MYRATHHLDSYILLTSKQRFPRLVGRYCSYLLPTQALSTFNLMSTEYRNQGAVSPRSTILKEVHVEFMTLNFLPGPLSCGKPEQPPNSTLISAAGKTSQSEYRIGSRIEYSCDEGHLLVGPSKRSCLHTGFYSEFPPVCRCEPMTGFSNDIVENISTIWKYVNHLAVSEYEPIILLQLVHLFQTCDMLDI